jgi:WD40 repeat protein
VDRPPPAIPDYEMLRRVGRGSYGEVWLARSVTGLYRAVKVIYRDQFDEDRPYEREFAGIKRFEPISRSHESQVDILHVGRNDAAGYFYYVMELADNASDGEPPSALLQPANYAAKTLKAVLATRTRLTVGEALPVAISLSEAVAHLHAHGLVHRDIKPSNIIFVNGRPKLADIGLIAASDANRSFVGTEGFVPREGPGTPQADIFAFGRVLYEMCTGRDRLEFPSLPEGLESLPDRAELRELNEVLLKACEPDPALRYASASDLKNDLELIRAQRSVRRLHTLERTVRRGRKLAVAGTLATLIVTFAWYQSHRFNRMAASQLAHVYVKNGQERLEQNDWLGALPWFAKALDLEVNLPGREAAHRLRIANMLEWCPQLAALYTHSKPVRYAFFNADATRVLLCDPGTTAQVWESTTDQPTTPKLEHGGQPFLGSFSPDGARVATASREDGAARLWNARTGALIGRPMLHGTQVRALAFSPDSQWLATAGDDGLVRLWSADDGTVAGPPLCHGAPVSLLAFSRDGERLLSAGGTNGGIASLCVWEMAHGWRLGSSLVESSSITASQFSPDGGAVLTGTDAGGICLWALDTHPSRRWTRSLDHSVFHTVFSPDGRRVLVASDWSARLLDAQTGEAVGPVIQSSSVLRSIDFSPDSSHFLLAGESRTALVYDSQTGKPCPPLLKHSGEIYRAFFLPGDEEWITASADGTVRRWRASPGERAQIVFSHTQAVLQVLFTPDSRWVITADAQGELRRWPLAPGLQGVSRAQPFPAEPVAAALSGDGQEIVLASQDGRLAVISSRNFETTATAAEPGGGIQRIVANPRGAQAALVARDGSLWLWDWQRRAMEPLRLPGLALISQIEFSADGRSLAIAAEKTVIPVQLTETTHIVGKRIQHEDRIWHIGFAGGRLLVSSEDRVMRWWDPATGAPLSPPMRGDGGINFAEFTADQERVFTSSANYDAMIWNARTGQPMTPPFKPRAGLNRAAFSPEGRWLALTSSEGSLQIWDSSSGEAMTPPLPTNSAVSFCRFSPDGRWLVTVEGGRRVVCRPFLLEAPPMSSSLDQAALLAAYRVDDHGFLAPISRPDIARLAKNTLPK